MKKIISLLLSLVLVITMFTMLPVTVSADEAPEHYLYGDANLDGVIDIRDTVTIQKYLTQRIGMDETTKEIADTDRMYYEGEYNLYLNIVDATYIQRYCAGLDGQYTGMDSGFEFTGDFEPGQEYVPPTDPAPYGDDLTVKVNSNLYDTTGVVYSSDSDEGIPDEIVVDFYIADTNSSLKMQACQFEITFNPDVLSFDPDKNGNYSEYNEKYYYEDMSPKTGGMAIVNPLATDGVIKFAGADVSGFSKSYSNEPLAHIVFDVKDGARGLTNINFNAKVITYKYSEGKTTYVDYVVCDQHGIHQDDYDYVMGESGRMYVDFYPEGGELGEEPTTDASTQPEPTTAEPTQPQPTTAEPTTAEPTTEPPAEKTLVGDINKDGVISVADATLVQQCAAELIDFNDTQTLAGDCNGDHIISVADATLIQKYAAEFSEDLLLTGTYI